MVAMLANGSNCIWPGCCCCCGGVCCIMGRGPPIMTGWPPRGIIPMPPPGGKPCGCIGWGGGRMADPALPGFCDGGGGGPGRPVEGVGRAGCNESIPNRSRLLPEDAEVASVGSGEKPSKSLVTSESSKFVLPVSLSSVLTCSKFSVLAGVGATRGVAAAADAAAAFVAGAPRLGTALLVPLDGAAALIRVALRKMVPSADAPTAAVSSTASSHTVMALMVRKHRKWKVPGNGNARFTAPNDGGGAPAAAAMVNTLGCACSSPSSGTMYLISIVVGGKE